MLINTIDVLKMTGVYFSAGIEQLYNLFMVGSGKFWTTLVAMKARLCSSAQIVVPTPFPFLDLPQEMAREVLFKLDPDSTFACLGSCRAIRNLCTYEEKGWLLFEKRWLNILGEERREYSVESLEVMTYYYSTILSSLFKCIKIAQPSAFIIHKQAVLLILAERFLSHLCFEEIEQGLKQAISRQDTADLPLLFDVLAQKNLHLCLNFLPLVNVFSTERCIEFLTERLPLNNTKAAEFLRLRHEAYQYQPILHFAVKHGYREIIPTLLENNPSCINIRDFDGSTILHEICSQRNTDEDDIAFIRWLLEQGAKLDFQTNNSGFTALMNAVRFGNNIAVIRLLLEYGADIHKRSSQGTTVLMGACMTDQNKTPDPVIVKALLKRKPELWRKHPLTGEDVFMVAQKEHNPGIEQLLLKHYQKTYPSLWDKAHFWWRWFFQ
jgi:hypothetical protein